MKKIDNILNNLINEYSYSLDNLTNYKNSEYYKSKNKNYEITVKKISQIRDEKEIIFYKFLITYPFKLRDKRQEILLIIF